MHSYYVCSLCNAYKGPNLTAIDPVTNRVSGLFHPRRHSWQEHFAFVGPTIIGLTPIGRATVRLLNMNDYPGCLCERNSWLLGTCPPKKARAKWETRRPVAAFGKLQEFCQ